MPVAQPDIQPVIRTIVDDEPVKALPPKPKTAVDYFPSGLVLSLAKPYLAGQSAQEALAIAHSNFSENQFTGTLDILGEDAQNDADCEDSVQHYIDLVDRISSDPLPANSVREQLSVSFKPSMFSTMAPGAASSTSKALDDAFDRIMRVVDYGAKHNIRMTLEAEDHRWTNFQLEAYFALINAGYSNLGTVLQTRLFRTIKDLQRFDSRMRVRLVIGIYNEPAQIAHTDKNVMKQLVVQFAQELLGKGVYTEIASHDIKLIDNFYETVVIPNRLSPYNFEHQFLQGVPRVKLERELVSGQYFEKFKQRNEQSDTQFIEQLQKDGALVRMYLPFGSARVSGAYCRRRLIENPNMIIFGMKNFLGIQ
ncbi:MAG: proline dehydrogenase family protein [Candidatus Obscuribacterales bacterium]|nr:proline dehydrogenase family protein [Candidatus Obscuribacterales bacterium]